MLSCPPCKATAAPPPASASAPTAAEADPDPCNRDHARLARLVSRSRADQFRDLSTRKFRRQQGRVPQRGDSTSRAWQSACLRVDLSHPSPPHAGSVGQQRGRRDVCDQRSVFGALACRWRRRAAVADGDSRHRSVRAQGAQLDWPWGHSQAGLLLAKRAKISQRFFHSLQWLVQGKIDQ